MFEGLRTAAYTAHDLAAAKAFYAGILGQDPYFDQPFYVGWNVGGYELGLIPSDQPHEPPSSEQGLAYWGVADIDAAVDRLVAAGATVRDGIQDVGEGIRTATLVDPFGNLLGVIYNPHFKLG